MNHKITKTKVDDNIVQENTEEIKSVKDNVVKDTVVKDTIVNDNKDNKHNEKIKIVYPGCELADTMDVLPGHGAYRDGSKIFSKVLGIAKTVGSVVSVTPLSGVYIPRTRDYVIGEVTDIGFSNWSVNIGGPYDATLSMNDVKEFVERNAELTRYYDIGDVLMCVVTCVTKSKFVNVGTKDPKARKLKEGLIVQITPSKVPRLIGKQGSTIGMIKDMTKCFILVGQNGRIWIKGDYETVAAKAVKKVDRWSTQSGLTDKIQTLIKKELKMSVPAGN